MLIRPIANREEILSLLAENTEKGERAVGRALVVLLKNQTNAEQRDEATLESNGVGFNAVDAKRGTRDALYYLQHKALPHGSLVYWRGASRNRKSRIAKYVTQLQVASIHKSVRLAAEADAMVRDPQWVENMLNMAFYYGH